MSLCCATNVLKVAKKLHMSDTLNFSTILFSHGNSSDLGTVYPTLIDISTQLKVDILAFDYSGYGLSEGKASEKAIYEDIEEIAEFLRNGLKLDFRKVILMGNSLGSAASIHLCTLPHYKDLQAVILLSPVVSGIKTFSQQMPINKEDLKNLDFFSNISKVNEIVCPVFIIHGEQDKLIPVEQVIQMAKSIRKVYQWYPKRGDHNNILSRYRTKFYTKCRMFFDYLRICYSTHLENKDSLNKNEWSESSKTYSVFQRYALKIEESYFDNSNLAASRETSNYNDIYLNEKEEDSYEQYFKKRKSSLGSNIIQGSNGQTERKSVEEKEKISLVGNLNNISFIENEFNFFQKNKKSKEDSI